MTDHAQDLVRFLAGELPRRQAEEFDRHLLSCDRCWAAVSEDQVGQRAARQLRTLPPPDLHERIRQAVESAARDSRSRPGRQRRRLPLRAAAAAVGAAVVTAGVAVAVVTAGESNHHPSAETSVGEPDTGPTAAERQALRAAGAREVSVATIHTGHGDAVIATSPVMFPRPSDAVRVSADGMAWSVRRGEVTLYCLNNDRPSVLLAGTGGLQELFTVAHELHLDQ